MNGRFFRKKFPRDLPILSFIAFPLEKKDFSPFIYEGMDNIEKNVIIFLIVIAILPPQTFSSAQSL